MVKKRKLNNRLEKDHQDSCEQVLTLAQKKVEEQAVKDSLAWKHALELLGLTQEFNYSDFYYYYAVEVQIINQNA
jgi:hypothetical protein